MEKETHCVPFDRMMQTVAALLVSIAKQFSCKAPTTQINKSAEMAMTSANNTGGSLRIMRFQHALLWRPLPCLNCVDLQQARMLSVEDKMQQSWVPGP